LSFEHLGHARHRRFAARRANGDRNQPRQRFGFGYRTFAGRDVLLRGDWFEFWRERNEYAGTEFHDHGRRANRNHRIGVALDDYRHRARFRQPRWRCYQRLVLLRPHPRGAGELPEYRDGNTEHGRQRNVRNDTFGEWQ
jgi:hypothetical protein